VKAKLVKEVFEPKSSSEVKNIIQSSLKQLTIKDRASIMKMAKGKYNFDSNSTEFEYSKGWPEYHDLLVMLNENGYKPKSFGSFGFGPDKGYSDYIHGDSEEEKKTYTYMGLKISKQSGIWIKYKVQKILDKMDFFFHDSWSDEEASVSGSIMLTELIPNENVRPGDNIKYNCSVSIKNEGTWKAGFGEENYFDHFDQDIRLYEGDEDQLLSKVAQKIAQAELFSMEQILKLQNYAAKW